MIEKTIITYYNKIKEEGKLSNNRPIIKFLDSYLKSSYRLKLKNSYNDNLKSFLPYTDSLSNNKKSKIKLFDDNHNIIACISERTFKKFLKKSYKYWIMNL